MKSLPLPLSKELNHLTWSRSLPSLRPRLKRKAMKRRKRKKNRV
jgi:hypothetical protein